jgi:tetratricopeptide (TPR) repeat protein
MKSHLLICGMFAALAGPAALADDEKLAACEARLRRLARAVQTATLVHDGQAPTSLQALYDEGWIESLGDLVCPAADTPPPAAGRLDERSSYTLAPLPGRADLIVREKAAHGGGAALLAITRTGERVTLAPQRPPPPPPGPVVATNATPVTLPVVTNAPAADVAGIYAQAVQLATAGRHAEALPLFDQVLAQQPQNKEAYWNRGVSRTWTGNLKGSVADLDAVLRFDPGNAEVRRVRTLAAIACSHDLASLRATAADLLRLHPNNASLLLLAGQVEWSLGNTAGAQQYFRQAQTRDPQILNNVFQQAGSFLQAGVPQMAFVFYSTVVWADPAFAAGHYGLGMAAAELGAAHRSVAIAALEQYLRTDATSAYAAAARAKLAELRL